jgi:GNAT superfamily N-acetyltransferase
VTEGIEIRGFEDDDLEAIVEFSLRAWEPVFESLRQVLGDAIFWRLHQPDWRTAQAESVRRGIAQQLMEHSTEHMRAQGMDIAAVGTGGDAGHGPARALYESLGYTALPGVRCLRLLP